MCADFRRAGITPCLSDSAISPAKPAGASARAAVRVLRARACIVIRPPRRERVSVVLGLLGLALMVYGLIAYTAYTGCRDYPSLCRSQQE